MSNLVINDLSDTNVLDRAAMAGIAGGTDVHIGKVSSTVDSTDGQSGIGGNLLGAILNSVIEGIYRQSHKPARPD